MYPSLRVANYILDLAFNEGVKVDHMKLQKLVYISHGWFLGFHHDPLTSDQPQAWRYGPVYRMLYDRCKAFGNKSIDTYIDIQNDGVIAPNEYKLDERANALVKKVWDGYKKYSALQLSSLTHKEGTPWHKTRTELGSGEVIPTKYISDYYQQKITHGRTKRRCAYDPCCPHTGRAPKVCAAYGAG